VGQEDAGERRKEVTEGLVSKSNEAGRGDPGRLRFLAVRTLRSHFGAAKFLASQTQGASNMITRFVRHAAAALVAYALLSPSEASAKFFLITTGDTMKEIGIAKGPNGETARIGYKYSYGGLFWLDFWTWSGTYCVILGEKEYFPLTEAEAAELLGKPAGSLSPPFFYRFPPGLMIVGALVVIGIVSAIVNKRGSVPPTDEEKLERVGES
jgi:hypothetical protein